MADPKVFLNYIYGNFGAKFKFGWLILRKDYKNSYKIDKVLVSIIKIIASEKNYLK